MQSNTITVTGNSFPDLDEYCVYNENGVYVYSTLGVLFNASFEKHKDGFKFVIGDLRSANHGVAVTYSSTLNRIQIDTDCLGTEILYYSVDADSFTVSNRLDFFNTGNGETDLASLYQFFLTGYFVGATTIYKSVKQTLCSEKITIQIPDDNPNNKYSVTSVDGKWQYGSSDAPPVEQILATVSKDIENTVLMTSAGWDSRTLLMNIDPEQIKAYTHGDLSSREISIAQRITGDMRIDHLFIDSRHAGITADLILEMIEQLGSAMFPIWYSACKNIHQIWNLPISSGVFGEVLGGHYGIDTFLGSRTRASSLLKFMIPGYQKQMTLDDVVQQYKPSTDLWYLKQEVKSEIFSRTVELKERIASEMRDYGTDDSELAVEQFMTKHRGRQYILKQAHASKNTVGYRLPFSNEQLLNSVLSVEFKDRMHNKLNRLVLAKHQNNLLNYPMAATLCNASKPIFIQEWTRAARLASELVVNKKNYGWFNYDFLFESTFFENIIDTCKSDIWDKSKIHENIRKQKDLNKQEILGYTLDTVCKLKTIDNLLSK